MGVNIIMIVKYFKHEYLADFEGVFHDQISLSNDVITICLTLEQFLQFESDYSLPAGYQERIYIQGDYNHLITSTNSIMEDVVPFPEGDLYIANAQNYIPPVIPEE